MKTSEDPRHKRRQETVQELFKIQFHAQNVSPRTKEIIANFDTINDTIQKAAPEFTIDKIHKVDLAVLQLAVYELLIEKKEPPHVIIDEAIELAKEFAGENSPAFVNGALGNVINNEKSS